MVFSVPPSISHHPSSLSMTGSLSPMPSVSTSQSASRSIAPTGQLGSIVDNTDGLSDRIATTAFRRRIFTDERELLAPPFFYLISSSCRFSLVFHTYPTYGPASFVLTSLALPLSRTATSAPLPWVSISLESWHNNGSVDLIALVSRPVTLQNEAPPAFVAFPLSPMFILESSLSNNSNFTISFSATTDLNWHFMADMDPTVPPVGSYGEASALLVSTSNITSTVAVGSFPGILLEAVIKICPPSQSRAVSFTTTPSMDRSRSMTQSTAIRSSSGTGFTSQSSSLNFSISASASESPEPTSGYSVGGVDGGPPANLIAIVASSLIGFVVLGACILTCLYVVLRASVKRKTVDSKPASVEPAVDSSLTASAGQAINIARSPSQSVMSPGNITRGSPSLGVISLRTTGAHYVKAAEAVNSNMPTVVAAGGVARLEHSTSKRSDKLRVGRIHLPESPSVKDVDVVAVLDDYESDDDGESTFSYSDSMPCSSAQLHGPPQAERSTMLPTSHITGRKRAHVPPDAHHRISSWTSVDDKPPPQCGHTRRSSLASVASALVSAEQTRDMGTVPVMRRMSEGLRLAAVPSRYASPLQQQMYPLSPLHTRTAQISPLNMWHPDRRHVVPSEWCHRSAGELSNSNMTAEATAILGHALDAGSMSGPVPASRTRIRRMSVDDKSPLSPSESPPQGGYTRRRSSLASVAAVLVSAELNRDTGAESATRRVSMGPRQSSSAVPSFYATPASPQQQREVHPLSPSHAPIPPMCHLHGWRPDLTIDVPFGSRRRSTGEFSNSNTTAKALAVNGQTLQVDTANLSGPASAWRMLLRRGSVDDKSPLSNIDESPHHGGHTRSSSLASAAAALVAAEQIGDSTTGAESAPRCMSEGLRLSAQLKSCAALTSPHQQLESHPFSPSHASVPPISHLHVWRPDLSNAAPNAVHSGSRRKSAGDFINMTTEATAATGQAPQVDATSLSGPASAWRTLIRRASVDDKSPLSNINGPPHHVGHTRSSSLASVAAALVSTEQTRDTGVSSVTRRMSDGFKMSAVPSCYTAPASPQQQLESHSFSPSPPISPLLVWRPDVTKDVPSGSPSRRRSAGEFSNSHTTVTRTANALAVNGQAPQVDATSSSGPARAWRTLIRRGSVDDKSPLSNIDGPPIHGGHTRSSSLASEAVALVSAELKHDTGAASVTRRVSEGLRLSVSSLQSLPLQLQAPHPLSPWPLHAATPPISHLSVWRPDLNQVVPTESRRRSV